MTTALERVRAVALDLPETGEKVSHGQPTFFVAGKQFAQFRDNHHGDGKTVVCVKTSSLDEQAMLLETTRKFPNVTVDIFGGLLVEYVAAQKAQAVLRGIRAISDYEYELQMALMNRRLDPGIETVFMMPADQYSYLSSRLVKEVFLMGGSIRGLVPDVVEERLHQKVRGTVKA